MANNKTKLELTWIGKENRPKLEPRILLEDPEKSYHAPHRVSDNDIFDNKLIFGDNLLALKALEQEYAGKIKCIYIDPPFNTGSAFEHYDDGVEHSIWLSLMKERLEILYNLLDIEGSIYVHIDNNEQAYLKVILDEIFGRKNFVQMISVKRASPAGFKVINPGPLTVTDYILLYAKDKTRLLYIPQRVPVEYDENYDLYIENPDLRPEEWRLKKLVDKLYENYNFTSWQDAKNAWGENWKSVRNSILGDIALKMKDTVVSVRDPHKPSQLIKDTMEVSRQQRDKVFIIPRDNMSPIYIYNGGSLSFYKNKVQIIDGVLTPTEFLTDFWADINFAGIAQEGGVQFKNSKKPEMLVKRIIEISTKPRDIVLDSFAGSGTTGAVAHKMGRRWIMVELGEHCHTHIIPRMKKVIEGTDQTGISKAVNWQGGGGFRYYRLAPSLLEKDKFGNWVISKDYNASMLAEAVCKLEGFTYSPSEEHYWMHGYSTESDFIYVTTQTLTMPVLEKISEEVGTNRSLLICCGAFRKFSPERFGNLTVKKIPKMVLNKCEWEHDDYSLEIENLPKAPPRPEPTQEEPKARTKEQRRKQTTLFEV